MEKQVQRSSVGNQFILFLAIIVIVGMHYSRQYHGEMQARKQVQKGSVFTSKMYDGIEIMEANSPFRIPARIMVE